MTVTYDNLSPDHADKVYLLVYDDRALHQLFDSGSSSYDFTGDTQFALGTLVVVEGMSMAVNVC